MADALSYMIERSKFDEQRLVPAPGAARADDPGLVDEAASALFACCYLQAHGTMFARTAAERRSASIRRALRRSGLERQVTRRLRNMAEGIGRFFRPP